MVRIKTAISREILHLPAFYFKLIRYPQYGRLSNDWSYTQGFLHFGRSDKNLHLEAFAQIKLATDGIVDEKILSAFALDAPIEN